MLDAYIIDELKREEEQRREEQRPQLELPLPPPGWQPQEQPEEPKRGVVTIQIA